MANPSLKAQIEAAKSALENSQETVSLDPKLDDSIAAETAPQATTEEKPVDRGIIKPPTNFESDVAKFDARITSLENKLAENQRDLHTLLGKIREVTRLQNNTYKNTRTRRGSPKDIGSDDQNVTRSRGRRIAITLAVFTGIISGAGLFLATDLIDHFFLHFPIWTEQFVDFIGNNIG